LNGKATTVLKRFDNFPPKGRTINVSRCKASARRENPLGEMRLNTRTK